MNSQKITTTISSKQFFLQPNWVPSSSMLLGVSCVCWDCLVAPVAWLCAAWWCSVLLQNRPSKLSVSHASLHSYHFNCIVESTAPAGCDFMPLQGLHMLLAAILFRVQKTRVTGCTTFSTGHMTFYWGIIHVLCGERLAGTARAEVGHY